MSFGDLVGFSLFEVALEGLLRLRFGDLVGFGILDLKVVLFRACDLGFMVVGTWLGIGI